MSNEEKILSMLADIQKEQKQTNERLDGMDKRLDQLEEGQKQTNERLDKIEARLDPIENETLKTRLEIENRIIPNIQKVAEGHMLIIEKMATKEDIALIREDWENERIALEVLAREVHG